MALDESSPPLDEKAKRTRELLASFYAPDPSASATSSPSRMATLDSINSAAFDPDRYMDLLIRRSNLEGLIQKHVEMAAEIKNLDTDLQMLVYENYNKFISATDTIKRMKNNIVGMEANMEQLLEKIVSVQSKSDGINTSLFQKREDIEKLHRTRNLLRKIQFIYDLPTRLGKCIRSEAYADAVRFFIGARPIFEAYGGSSFQDCKKASEEAMDVVIRNLQAKLYSDSEPIEARAEAVVLLKQLGYPVDDLKSKLLEKLEVFLSEYQCDPSQQPPAGNLDSIDGFSKAVRAYRIIFPESERRLIELTQGLFTRRFDDMQHWMHKSMTSAELLSVLREIWADVSVMDEVLPEAALPVLSFEAARDVIKLYISRMFSFLLDEIQGVVTGSHEKSKRNAEELQFLLESGKGAVIQGTSDLLKDFRHLLDDNLAELKKLGDLIVEWVQESFKDFFKALAAQFRAICGKSDSSNQDGVSADKVASGTVLVLVQLSVFIEQVAIPRINQEIAASFFSDGLSFVPVEICRIFHSAAEGLLKLYINRRTEKISVLLKKRFMTPNWVKHKEPREVHMFVELLLQDLEAISNELRQTLPHGILQKHQRSESAGSTNSSRSNQMREERISRSTSQRVRSQLFESHLAKLFEQKMEIFTKVEFTQESVLSTIVKLCLKSLQEFIRLQTFNRSGFQQIQLDMEFLKSPLKEIAGDEAAIDFLFKEVNNAAHERCLDPTPLEPAIVDKLIQAKQAKHKESLNAH